MPGPFVFIQYFFDYVYQALVRCFSQPISLGVISSGMDEDDIILLTEVDHGHGLEGLGIVSNNLSGKPKS